MLVAVMGSDLNIVNAARASRGQVSKKLTARDRGLLRYLAHPGDGQEPHESPFRHAVVRFEFETTILQRLQVQELVYDAGMVFRPNITESDQITEYTELGWIRSWRWTLSLDAAIRWAAAAQDTALSDFANTQVLWLLSRYFPGAVRERTTEAYHLQFGEWGTPINQPPYEGQHLPFIAGSVELVDYLEGPTADESILSFRIEAPVMVARQWFKYVRRGDHSPAWLYEAWEEGSGNGDDSGQDPMGARNERSWRIEQEPEFYTPSEWRRQSGQNKQGDGGTVLDEDDAGYLTSLLTNHRRADVSGYKKAIELGAESGQARLFLPSNGLITSWVWTASVPQVAHFLQQREHPAAQGEIRDAARAVRELASGVLPQYIRETA